MSIKGIERTFNSYVLCVVLDSTKTCFLLYTIKCYDYFLFIMIFILLLVNNLSSQVFKQKGTTSPSRELKELSFHMFCVLS